jgi:polar amino acid transport system substrate-binding protein
MRRLLVAALATAMLAALGGCGSSDDGPAKAGSTSSEGKALMVATDPSFVPWSFQKNGQWQGINVDLAEALSRELGQELELVPTSFDNTIPGLAAGRYDLALQGMFDNAERQKAADFVDYARSSSGVLVRADDDATYKEVSDLCGVKVGVQRGSFDEMALSDEPCKGKAASKIDVTVLADNSATVLTLASGRVDAVSADAALVGLRALRAPDDFKVADVTFGDGVVGITLAKDSPLRDKIRDAVQQVMDSGEMASIFKRWGVSQLALERATVNAGP